LAKTQAQSSAAAKSDEREVEAGNRGVWSNCLLQSIQGLLKVQPRERWEFMVVIGAVERKVLGDNANRLKVTRCEPSPDFSPRRGRAGL
jgi:hypothetical protein